MPNILFIRWITQNKRYVTGFFCCCSCEWSFCIQNFVCLSLYLECALNLKSVSKGLPYLGHLKTGL